METSRLDIADKERPWIGWRLEAYDTDGNFLGTAWNRKQLYEIFSCLEIKNGDSFKLIWHQEP